MIVVGQWRARQRGDWDHALAAEAGCSRAHRRGGGVIVYTSGTTGKPKGANRSWRRTGFESVADMILQVGKNANDRHLVVCPLYHSAAPAFVAIMMSLGATVVLMNHFEPEGALDIIRAGIPVLADGADDDHPAREPAGSYSPEVRASSLRWVMSAAAPLTTRPAPVRGVRLGAVELLWRDRDRARHARRSTRPRRSTGDDRARAARQRDSPARRCGHDVPRSGRRLYT
jgi:fatty-acyl-CoA synthase